MKTTIEIEICDFEVPLYVKRYNAFNGEHLDTFINELDSEILNIMCDKFKQNVFKLAGKNEPDKVTCENPDTRKIEDLKDLLRHWIITDDNYIAFLQELNQIISRKS